MELNNPEVLENLLKQKTEMETQMEVLRTNYLKVLGAIDVLSQIEESKTPEASAEVESTEEVAEG
mgnify:CR=1 FL=1